jgi:RNA polymerase sigma-70 factor (ECF subfamily)
MVQAAEGDTEAFRCLVQRWEQSTFSFLYHMVGSREDAEDLTQDTFVRVHAQAGRYRPEGRFKSWLFRIAGNLARSHLRRRRLLRWLRFDARLHDQPDSEPLPDEVLTARSRQAAVRKALARLPDRQRQAVVLRRYESLSYAEIAVALDTTVSAVESLLQRAAANLRQVLAGEVDTT